MLEYHQSGELKKKTQYKEGKQQGDPIEYEEDGSTKPNASEDLKKKQSLLKRFFGNSDS